MSTTYIHQRPSWPTFHWDSDAILPLTEEVCRKQGSLYGRLSMLGFDEQLKAMAVNVANDVVTSSEIEGVKLNVDDVRSSIARRMGIESMVADRGHSHYIDGIISVMLDATEHFDTPLTKERLCNWQAAFFPTGRSGGMEIEVGCYRTHPEHIVSGYLGREKIHFVAPEPERVEHEMNRFLDWFNDDKGISPIVKSAIAHFWFVTIHPFEDGNGRLARVIADMALAHGDGSRLRFYNMSTQINREKKRYYLLLEEMQRGDGNLTEWLKWYIEALTEAIDDASMALSSILSKSIFWRNAASLRLSERQINGLNIFLDGYDAKITSKTWHSLLKCSRETAVRDLADLLSKGLIREDCPGSKRPSYHLRYTRLSDADISSIVKAEVAIIHDIPHIVGEVNGHRVNERISELDHELLQRGEASLISIIEKHLAYLL